MNSSNSANKRIARNTLMLYFRHILILLVSLYTVRVVLSTLGIEDYGVYNVVGGIVALFSFLSNSMASATQRYFSFALGANDKNKLKKIFSVNLIIYAIIAFIAVILLETVGLWYVTQELRIPPERYEAAIWVYHFSILTFAMSVMSAPFMAIIIAHEDMQIYAYVSIIEAVLKLCIVFLLVHLLWDKLIVYGILIFTVAVINSVIYIAISIKKYDECQFHKFYWDKSLLKDLLSFTGWTLFGQLTTVFRTQAVTILLNQFFNPIVVSARAIATNVSGQINVFSSNFNTGLYPPIIKTYAANEKQQMFSLIFNGSKITFFLMWVFALPLFLEMDALLLVWLGNVPEGTVLFTRLALIESLIHSVSMPITTAARAPGKMKLYELTLGGMQIFIFIASLIVLKMGAKAYAVYVVAIIINLLMFIVRLFIVRRLILLPLSDYFRQVMLPVLKVLIFSFLLSLGMNSILPKDFIFSLISIVFSIIVSSVCMFYMGLTKEWKKKVIDVILIRIKNIFS